MAILSANDLIYGYTNGIFPMADEENQLYWYSPDPRAIIPIDTYKPPKSLRPIINSNKFEIKINTDFEGVMRGCSLARTEHDSTWISEEIISAYTDLHFLGYAHSVEAYFDKQLVGGLYGVAIGTAFFGESMFYTMSNASKVAFHFLIERLRQQKYELLDTQFINDNVLRYGAIEIPKSDYIGLLRKAISRRASFVEKNESYI